MTIIFGAALLVISVFAILGRGVWMQRTRTTTTVFVDDAVRGDLPPTCAFTGAPADAIVRLEQPLKPFEPLWLLLLLLGPIGVVALVAAALVGSRSETITAVLPATSDSLARYRGGVRRRRLALVALAVGAAVLLVSDGLAAGIRDMAIVVGLASVVGGVLAAADAHNQAMRYSVRITLDGSRRWMTIRGVHPTFAAAVHRDTSLRRTG